VEEEETLTEIHILCQSKFYLSELRESILEGLRMSISLHSSKLLLSGVDCNENVTKNSTFFLFPFPLLLLILYQPKRESLDRKDVKLWNL
jgi:hypothetical protein